MFIPKNHDLLFVGTTSGLFVDYVIMTYKDVNMLHGIPSTCGQPIKLLV